VLDPAVLEPWAPPAALVEIPKTPPVAAAVPAAELDDDCSGCRTAAAAVPAAELDDDCSGCRTAAGQGQE
jgi:hypothetical protein